MWADVPGPVERRILAARPGARLKHVLAASALTLTLGLAAPARPAPAAAWTDSYVGRLEALAALETLNGALLASHSATQTLETWCADHHMAEPARITALRVAGADKAITAEQRQQLQIGPDEPVRYRRVRLACGAHVLSEADNWYAPSRLTPEMNSLLETTDIPFGRVIAPLHPSRQTLSADPLWAPLPPGWELRTAPAAPTGAAQPLDIPAFLFRHRALVLDGQGRPLSEVVETYTGEILNFGRPTPP